MTDATPDDVTDEELDDQRAEQLPDRQAMSIVTPGFERPMPLDSSFTEPPVEDGGPNVQ